MRVGVKKHLEEILRDYPRTDQYIKQREQEIKYPYQPFRDENVGGGKQQGSTSEDTARTAIDMAMDRILMGLRYNQQCIKHVLTGSDDETKEIITVMYFTDKRPTAKEVSDQINVSPATLSRKRMDFLVRLSRELGFKSD